MECFQFSVQLHPPIEWALKVLGILLAGDPESKDDVEADTSGDETDPVDPGHKARDEMFAAVASIRIGY